MVFHSIVQLLQPGNPKIRVPNSPAIAQIIQVRLPIIGDALQHDLNIVTSQDAKNIRFMRGKRIAGKSQFLFIPADRGAYVSDCEDGIYAVNFHGLCF